MSPGSYFARNLGCTCPPVSNAYGVGIHSAEAACLAFVVNPSCSTHGLVRWANPTADASSHAWAASTARFVENADGSLKLETK